MHRENLGEIKYRHDFTTQWAYLVFKALRKISALHLKYSSFCPSADDKWMSNDLAHALPPKCMFALSLHVPLYVQTYTIQESTISNRRKPKSCLGQVFSSRLGCFVAWLRHTPTSRVENSAEVTSYQYTLLHGYILSTMTMIFGKMSVEEMTVDQKACRQ